MTTLNARANQAYRAMVDEAGDNWMGYSHQRDAFEDGWETGYKTAEVDMNAALEAAAPLLGPRPQVGVVHVQHADSEEYARIFNLGFAEAVEQYADESRPLLDREAVRDAISDELDGEGVVSYGLAPKLTDRVMELARPMPTEVEIAERVRRIFMDGGAARTHAQEAASEIADAVVALLNGAES